MWCIHVVVHETYVDVNKSKYTEIGAGEITQYLRALTTLVGSGFTTHVAANNGP